MPDVAKNSSLKFHKYFYWFKKRLTLWVTYWYICCGSIFTFGAKFFEPVQIFQPKSIWFFILFLRQTKKYFWHLWSSLHLPSSPHLHSTCLTFYFLPALPTSQPIFFLPRCLPCEPWMTDLWFSFGFMSWCLTSEPRRLECKFPYFFSYIYTVLVIHFLKLFKSDMYIGPSPSQS